MNLKNPFSSRPRGGSGGDAQAPEGSDPNDTEILNQNEGSIILSILSQLRAGADLHRVTFPTFVLEPRSMLERITDFMSHPELIFGADELPSEEERFIAVLRYYLSGWHIKPRGVKKPYNPVLGEFFRCRYDYPNGTKGFYIAEQVSHHPPISAYFYVSPANGIRIQGELRPKSGFTGNSVETTMDGDNRVFFLRKPEEGEYVVTMPHMYARGILFGKMVLELGETCVADCEATKMKGNIVFKTKGMLWGGSYNEIEGKVFKDGTPVGEISGKWSHVMNYKDSKGETSVLFDANSDEGKQIAPKFVPPEEEQEPNESRRLWKDLTAAIKKGDMGAATDAKTEVEEAQRRDNDERERAKKKFAPRFFEQDASGRWLPKFQIPEDPEEATKAVQEWIWAAPPS